MVKHALAVKMSVKTVDQNVIPVMVMDISNPQKEIAIQ
jgi:hypothetical protein